MATVDGLRPVHIATLEAARAFHAEHGRTPTNTELARIVGVVQGTMSQRLSILEARGYITRLTRGSRPFVLTDKAHAWSGA
jgi:DNA-binding MarR family transcriptional regulator